MCLLLCWQAIAARCFHCCRAPFQLLGHVSTASRKNHEGGKNWVQTPRLLCVFWVGSPKAPALLGWFLVRRFSTGCYAVTWPPAIPAFNVRKFFPKTRFLLLNGYFPPVLSRGYTNCHAPNLRKTSCFKSQPCTGLYCQAFRPEEFKAGRIIRASCRGK